MDIPESLLRPLTDPLAERIQRALRNAYAEGYRKGGLDAAERIFAAAKAEAKPETLTPSIQQPPQMQVSPAASATTASRVRAMHPNSADARRFPYGAVSEAFRTALMSASVFGLTKPNLIERVGVILGADVSDMDHRDTLKRLKKTNELRVHEGRYYPGAALKTRNENGAPTAKTEDAPETALPAL